MIEFKKYKNLFYSNIKGNKEEEINGEIYYRYMDKIYIPNKVKFLSNEDVQALSEIRIKLNNEVIDYQYSKEVSLYLLSKINKENKKNIIDFGCGGGFLIDCIKKEDNVVNYYGLDCTKESLELARSNIKEIKDFNIFFQEFDKEKKINLKSNSIDSIISCFVMHFNIYDSQLKELKRVLKKNGQFVYNDFYHKKNPEHKKKIIRKLLALNFQVKIELVNFNQGGIEKSHEIIIARKK